MDDFLNDPDASPVWAAEKGEEGGCLGEAPGTSVNPAAWLKELRVGSAYVGDGGRAGGTGGAKPNEDLGGAAVDRGHEADLVGAFREIELVNAYSIDPLEGGLQF